MGPALRAKGESCDYVQDAMVEFLRYGPRFLVSSDAAFRALLVRIVENTLINRHRWYVAARREIARERPLPGTTVLSLDPEGASTKTPSQSAERHEREAWVRLAVELLSPDDREMLVLRMWQGVPFTEIARRLGVDPSTARQRLHRALRHLAATAAGLRRDGVSALANELIA